MSNNSKDKDKLAEKFPSFEESYQRMNQIVEKLEAGGLGLEEATVLLQEGMSLAALCSKQLNQAELKVKELENVYQHDGENDSE